ncbi:MAG: peptidoglycan-binding protein, partial [Christensenellaceae bacterium]|nr:peptidoglycan-binding protein [Christensenellaceae bacterium]
DPSAGTDDPAGSGETEKEKEPEKEPLLLKEGSTGPDIAKLQERLMDLGYMDNDEPTELFGPATETAVELFQRRHELEMDGKLDQEEWDLLFSKDAKKYSVTTGTAGQDVKELQTRLRELGYLDKVTSYYGDETTAAVKKFQENNKLSVDGTIGMATREMLYSEDAVANSVKYGEESEEVKKFQKRLKKLGYMTEEPTGYFGPATVAAVRKFQEKNGLIADGAIGPITEEKLMSSDAQINALIVGSKGDDVTKVQNRLVKLNYLKSATGYYGTDTEKAVRNFQSRNGLTVDGKVGPKTNEKLFSDSAKKAASAPSSTGGDSKPSKPSGGSKPSTTVTPDAKDVESLIKVAKSKLGCRYVRGGKGPNTFDCSGFVYWCLNQIGVKQGYMTSGGWKNTSKYPEIHDIDKLKRGDIIVFKGHVAIALGGGQYIDASSSQGKIRITSIGSWARRNFIKGCRVL